MFKLTRLPVVTGALLLSLGVTFFANPAFADPSGRVAYLSDTQGEVSYSPSGENQWIGVVRNRPLIRGDRLWSDRNSRVEFQVGSSVVRLGQNTGVELLDLDDNIAQLQLSEGSINVRVRRLYRGQTIEVATPMLAFSINRRGRYRIDVDPYDGQTTVTVWQGAGTAYGQRASFRVRAGEAVAFYDVYLTDYEIYGVADDDDFDLYAQGRDRYWDESVSLNYVGDDVVGYAALDLYGSWSTHQNYGNVWYPRDVARNWAPYRDGHWVWQEPWGWTWVDNAPWGFAPSHYGRWVSVRNRWGWVPGPRHVRPIYAPAVVAFVGGSGWSLSLSLGGGSSAIGWFPLGPREVYVPSYHTSRDYFNRVNVNNTVINNTTITNVYNNYSSGDINVNQVNYVNSNVSSAVTAVPSNVFVNAQPVRQAALQFDNKALQGTEITRVAPLTPIERSVLGAGKAVKNQPKREVFDRRVVAYNTPPPAQVEFAKREKQLQKQPGRALEPAAVDTAQGTYTKPVANVLVINDQKEVIDSRASRKDTTAQPVKSERLDRSAIAKHKAGRVRNAEQLPGAEKQAAEQQQQRKADSDKQAAEQQQRKAASDKQAAEQQQRKAASDKQAAEQQQRKAASDKQAAERQQRKAESDKQAAEQQQRKAASDKQAADQQRKAESDKQAAEQQQRKAASDKQAAEQQQRKAASDKQAAEQQQRKAASDKQAAEQQQRKADSDRQAAEQQQRKAASDKQAAEQQQRKADDRQAAEQQQRKADDRQAAEQQQRKAASDKQAAEQQQRKAASEKQAAEQQQRKAASDKQAAEQQQRKADSDRQAAEQQQRKAASDKQAAEQQQRKADSDRQAAEQQQRKAASDKQAADQQRKAASDRQAAEQQQRKAASDKQAAEQQQRKADSDRQAAEQQQRKAASDKQAAEQQQRKADSDRQAAEQQQRKADSDRQAAEQQQRKAESDKQAINESAAQQPQPRQDKPANEQQPKSKAQAECEREARKQGKDDSACKDL